MAKLVIALICFGIAALAGLLLFAQPDWVTLATSKLTDAAFLFLGLGGLIARLP